VIQYEVANSLNGTDFEKIATIASLCKGESVYKFFDQSAYSGKSLYYGVKQGGLNGTSSYSSVMTVTASSNLSSTILFPNPLINKTWLDLDIDLDGNQPKIWYCSGNL